MKRMLINATQTEELRVALVEIKTQNLLDLIVERQSYKTKLGNIYLGKITSIEPSLDAVFVSYGGDRHGFLPIKEISRDYFLNVDAKKQERASVKDLLKEGQHVMVQVEKEERGNKGAALTTFLSLAGSYLVLMPNNPRAGGISRRVEGDDRDELKEILSNLPLPDSMGLIVRTAGVGKTASELEWDLNTLLKQWEAIKKASVERSPPFLIHQESDVVIRTIRDYLRQDVTEILVDDVKLHEKIKHHLEQIRPDFVHCLKLYTGNVPLFNRYQIEHQIESAHQREVRLPSGGSIVIDHTEALVAVDVNSARATKGGDIEETALNTNLEAAEEVARQLRLRDIGGLIVIDFIDMLSMRHRREVENHLRNALKLDKARTQIGGISSRFGLLELSRQRLRHSLGEATQVMCPRCDGWGTIRGVESLALSIIRMIEEDAVKAHTAQIQVQLPIDVATFIINEKREILTNIEKNRNVEIIIIPNPKLESPHHHIKRLTEEEAGGVAKTKASYRLLETRDLDQSYNKKSAQPLRAEEKPAVDSMFSSEFPNPNHKKTGTGIIKRLLSGLFGTQDEEGKSAPSTGEPTSSTTNAAPTKSSNHQGQRRTGGRPNHGRSNFQHGRRDNAERPVRQNSSTMGSAAASTTSPITSSKDTAITPKDSSEPSQSGEYKGGRTRRGARGGRRRISGSYKPSGRTPATLATITVPENDTLPTHLPPLPADPSDLESYYKESVGIGKQGRQHATKPSAATQSSPETEDRNIAAPKASLPSSIAAPINPPAQQSTSTALPLEPSTTVKPKEVSATIIEREKQQATESSESKPVIIRVHTAQEENSTTQAEQSDKKD